MLYSITVKNIPTDIYERLKRSAKANRRSINSEIITIIEAAVSSQAIVPEKFLVQTRVIREKPAKYKITDKEFTNMKAGGRP